MTNIMNDEDKKTSETFSDRVIEYEKPNRHFCDNEKCSNHQKRKLKPIRRKLELHILI